MPSDQWSPPACRMLRAVGRPGGGHHLRPHRACIHIKAGLHVPSRHFQERLQAACRPYAHALGGRGLHLELCGPCACQQRRHACPGSQAARQHAPAAAAASALVPISVARSRSQPAAPLQHAGGRQRCAGGRRDAAPGQHAAYSRRRPRGAWAGRGERRRRRLLPLQLPADQARLSLTVSPPSAAAPQIVLETGEIGRQASGAVMATDGETVRCNLALSRCLVAPLCTRLLAPLAGLLTL